MWVVLGVLCGLALLLCIPVSALVCWDDGASVAVRWLFLRFPVYPRPPKREKAEKKKKQGDVEADKPPPPEKHLGLAELAAMAEDVVQSAGGPLRMIFRNLRIRGFVLDASLAGEDAADVAIKFGEAQACARTALGMLQSYIRVVKPELRLRPDFLGEQSVFTVRFCAQLTPLVVLAAGVRAGCAFLGRVLRRGAAGGAKEPATTGAARPVKVRSGTANE